MTASPALIPSLRRATAGNISMLSEFRTDVETFAHIAEARPFDKSVFVVTHSYTFDGEEVSETYIGTLAELTEELAWLEASDEIHVRRVSARIARMHDMMQGLMASLSDDGRKTDAHTVEMLDLCRALDVQLARLDSMRQRGRSSLTD